jgi:branched-chain amino acid transport system permease protein
MKRERCVPNYELSNYLQFVLSGISTGSIYVLVALGIVTIYSVTGIVNLAQGEYCMLAMLLAHIWGFLVWRSWPGRQCHHHRHADRTADRAAAQSHQHPLIMITSQVSIVVRGIAFLA